jgi:hypothetical protein
MSDDDDSVYRVGESSALKMEAAGSFEILVMIYRLHTVSSQRAVLVYSS